MAATQPFSLDVPNRTSKGSLVIRAISRSLPLQLKALLRHDRRFAWVLAGVVFATLGLLATWIHPLEVPQYENDRYHLQAEALLSGSWPRDVYRPMLYVLLTAALGWTTGDCFLGGKLVSALSIALLVLATHRMARELHGRTVAVTAAILTAVAPLAIRYGIVAGTDALFTATFTLALYASIRASRTRDLKSAAMAGLAFALAYWSRYPAIVALPIALLGSAIGAKSGERLRRTATCLGAAVLGLVPHMTLTWLQFGRPFYDENWRNVALRHYSPTADFGYLLNNPFHGLTSVLRHDPALVLQHTLDELLAMWNYGLREVLAGPDSDHTLRAALFVLVLVSALVSWTRRGKAALLLALGTGGYLLLVAATFFSWERFLLPALPPMLVMLAFGLARGIPRMVAIGKSNAFRARIAIAAPAAISCALLWSACAGADALSQQQPLRVVEVARELAQQTGTDVGIVSNYGFLSRHCPGRHHMIWMGRDPCISIATQRPTQGAWHWLVASRAGLDDAAWRALDAISEPWLQRVIDEPSVRAWRVVM
jgi:4-amino-4-deoxy-L-arabinose transferase-like glycosyltransferase